MRVMLFFVVALAATGAGYFYGYNLQVDEPVVVDNQNASVEAIAVEKSSPDCSDCCGEKATSATPVAQKSSNPSPDCGDACNGCCDVEPAATVQIANEPREGYWNNASCPVMKGKPAREQFTGIYQGKKILFCCAPCVSMFNDDPQKYHEQLLATIPK